MFAVTTAADEPRNLVEFTFFFKQENVGNGFILRFVFFDFVMKVRH